VSREALLVSYCAMSDSNLQAVDRAVRIVRELDRYHGFVAAERRLGADDSSLETPAPARLPTLEALLTVRLEISPQRLENIASVPGIGMASATSDPQDLVDESNGAFTTRLAAPARSPLAIGPPLTIRPGIGAARA
jgi:hypothetical protein